MFIFLYRLLQDVTGQIVVIERLEPREYTDDNEIIQTG